MKLTNRTILITGGSDGIGLAFAVRFADLGNEVIVTGRRQALLDNVKERHPRIHTIKSDVADPEQITALARHIEKHFPALDVLINNAGISRYRNVATPASDLLALMDEMNINAGCHSACNIDPLSRGIGVQN
jgi:uncharacterized oxidoreductase